MFKKIRNAMLALAAVATLGLGALVATTNSADARGGFHGSGSFRGGHIGGMRHIGGPRLGGAHIGGRVHLHHRIRIGHHRPHFHRPHFRPHWCWRHPWRCKIHVRWPRPVFVGAPVIAATTYAVAPVAAAPRPCTCLTKEYTPDNLVVFKDVCTKEVASAPVGNTQVQLPMPQQDDPTQPQTK